MKTKFQLHRSPNRIDYTDFPNNNGGISLCGQVFDHYFPRVIGAESFTLVVNTTRQKKRGEVKIHTRPFTDLPWRILIRGELIQLLSWTHKIAAELGSVLYVNVENIS